MKSNSGNIAFYSNIFNHLKNKVDKQIEDEKIELDLENKRKYFENLMIIKTKEFFSSDEEDE